MKILVYTFIILWAFAAGAANNVSPLEKGKKPVKRKATDPNNFFKDRTWNWDIKDYGKLHATSRYIGEPINTPNLLKLSVICPDGKKQYYPIVKGFKYCGITSISPAGRMLVVHFMDWNSNKPTKSCSTKRVERIVLPDVCNKSKTAQKSKKSRRAPASKKKRR